MQKHFSGKAERNPSETTTEKKFKHNSAAEPSEERKQSAMILHPTMPGEANRVNLQHELVNKGL